MSVTGQKTSKMQMRYAGATDQQLVANSAIDLMTRFVEGEWFLKTAFLI